MDQERKAEMKKQEAVKEREGEAITEAKTKLEKPEIKLEEDRPVEKEMEKETKKVEEPKKKIEVVKTKKIEAKVMGLSLHVSTKHAIAICNFIRGKNIDVAIAELGDVEKMKRAIPMRGEIPHRKGMMSGRYPVKAIGEFIRLLKSLKANAIANELELEKVRIFCVANKATRPYRRFGRKRFKRTHVEVKLVSIVKNRKEINDES